MSSWCLDHLSHACVANSISLRLPYSKYTRVDQKTNKTFFTVFVVKVEKTWNTVHLLFMLTVGSI